MYNMDNTYDVKNKSLDNHYLLNAVHSTFVYVYMKKITSDEYCVNNNIVILNIAWSSIRWDQIKIASLLLDSNGIFGRAHQYNCATHK